jgi:hypothetical protein
MILAALSRAMKPRNLSAGNKTTAIQLQEPFLHRDHVSHKSEPSTAAVILGVLMIAHRVFRVCENIIKPDFESERFGDDVFASLS